MWKEHLHMNMSLRIWDCWYAGVRAKKKKHVFMDKKDPHRRCKTSGLGRHGTATIDVVLTQPQVICPCVSGGMSTHHSNRTGHTPTRRSIHQSFAVGVPQWRGWHGASFGSCAGRLLWIHVCTQNKLLRFLTATWPRHKTSFPNRSGTPRRTGVPQADGLSETT